MTEFITNNYPIIIIVAAFLIFALIGFAVDSTKNKKKGDLEQNQEVNNEVTTPIVEEEIVMPEGNLKEETVIPEIDNVQNKQ